jgi:hypothetical protein
MLPSTIVPIPILSTEKMPMQAINERRVSRSPLKLHDFRETTSVEQNPAARGMVESAMAEQINLLNCFGALSIFSLFGR